MAEYGSLPFKEQIDFFKGKVPLDTASWTDIWEGMHARAFVIAGATKDNVLLDMRKAVDKAIADGSTLEEFRKDFDAIVKEKGWAYNGGRNWRTWTIYETNMRQSYNTGRELQMRDPELRKRRPYGLYQLGPSQEHRKEHEAWDGLVLPLDDPWWQTHTPQNGWGCKCRKLMVSDADVERMGLKLAQSAPPLEMRKVTVGKGDNQRTVDVPKGIDPGFAYNPGTAAWGTWLTPQQKAYWDAQKSAAWEPIETNKSPSDYSRPAQIPVAGLPGKLGGSATTKEELQKEIERQIGGASQIFMTPKDATGKPTAINVVASVLAQHVELWRTPYAALLEDIITDPYEHWVAWDRHKGTGEVILRHRFVKRYADRHGNVILVANAQNGFLEAYTIVPGKGTKGEKYLNDQRRGVLLYGK